MTELETASGKPNTPPVRADDPCLTTKLARWLSSQINFSSRWAGLQWHSFWMQLCQAGKAALLLLHTTNRITSSFSLISLIQVLLLRAPKVHSFCNFFDLAVTLLFSPVCARH